MADHAADRLGIAEMTIGADHARDGVSDLHAVSHLGDGAFLVLSDHQQRRVLVSLGLRWQRHRDGGGFLRQTLIARGLAEAAPVRHAARTVGRYRTAVRIKAGSSRQFASAGLIGVCSCHVIVSFVSTVDPEPSHNHPIRLFHDTLAHAGGDGDGNLA